MACIRLTGNYYILYPSIFLMSLSFGYTLSLLSFRYGLRGILCMLAYLCPQYFIYIPLMVLILREVSSQIDRAFPASLRRSVVIFCIIIAGCGVESYINPCLLYTSSETRPRSPPLSSLICLKTSSPVNRKAARTFRIRVLFKVG